MGRRITSLGKVADFSNLGFAVGAFIDSFKGSLSYYITIGDYLGPSTGQ